MTNKIQKAFSGGIMGTAAMTLVMFGAPLFGMPKLSPPEMLSMMLGLPIIAGWLMHFMIGIIFALMYVFFINRILKRINNVILKGVIFGLFAFTFGQIMIAIIAAIFWGTPPMEGSIVLIMIESILDHLVFGVVVALYVKEYVIVKSRAAAAVR